MNAHDPNHVETPHAPAVAPRDLAYFAPGATVGREHQPTGRRGRFAVTLLVIAALVGGVAAGAKWHGSIGHLLGLHKHDDGAAAGQKKQLWTCSMHPQVIQDHPGNCPICGMALEPMKDDGTVAGGGSPAAHEHAAGASVHIDPVVVQNMGLRVAPVGTGPVRRTVRAVGYLEVPQPNVHDVNLRISGWVERLYADTEGMAIKKGDPLFELYSPEVQVAVEELITARKAAASQGGNADAQAKGVAGTLQRAARRKLAQWGLDDSQIERLAALDTAPRTVTFLSPVSGDLAEKVIVQGASAMMNQRALQIVDRSTLWLDAQVHAMDLAFIKVGQPVAATVEGVTGRRFEGKVVFIDPRMDATTRTVRVRVAVPNPDLALRPGMFATVLVTAELLDKAMLVPREAVLDTGTRQVVFVASREEGHFEPRHVTLGPASEDGAVQVLSGLEAGETVVVSGQFLLDAESRMKEAVQKHLRNQLLREKGGPGPGAALAKVVGTPQWRGAVDAVVRDYLTVAAFLGEVQHEQKPVEFGALAAAAAKLRAAAAGDDQQRLADAIVAATAPLGASPVEAQRKGFKAVSDAVVALAEKSPPSKAALGGAAKLYLMRCPMFPGSWLQANEQMANPYYADTMKACASVVRTIDLQ